jgi:hypothetical protein
MKVRFTSVGDEFLQPLFFTSPKSTSTGGR